MLTIEVVVPLAGEQQRLAGVCREQQVRILQALAEHTRRAEIVILSRVSETESKQIEKVSLSYHCSQSWPFLRKRVRAHLLHKSN